MKRRISSLLVAFFIFAATGCMKMDYSMKVNKDKSVEFDVIQALNKQMLESSESNMVSEKELEQYKKDGYTIEEYSDDNNKGYRFKLKIDNIDSISTDEDITTDLDLYSTEDGKKYFFTVEKGLFRNKYKAVFAVDMGELGEDEEEVEDTTPIVDSKETLVEPSLTEPSTTLDTTTPSTTVEPSTTLDTTTPSTTVEPSTTDDKEEDLDISMEESLNGLSNQLMANMEAKFSITVPYGVIKSNATEVSKDGNTLTWNLIGLSDDISFEFYLYNIVPILVAGGASLLVILIIIILIVRHSKNKKYLKLALEREAREKAEATIETVEEVAPVVEEVITSETAPAAEEIVTSETTPVVEEIITPETTPVAEEIVTPETAPMVEEVINEEPAPVAEEIIFEPIVSEAVEEDSIEEKVEPSVDFEPVVGENNFHVEEIVTPENVADLTEEK